MGGEQLIQIGAQYGAAGVVAVVMYLLLRGQNEVLITVVKENTTAITKLSEQIAAMKDRRP